MLQGGVVVRNPCYALHNTHTNHEPWKWLYNYYMVNRFGAAREIVSSLKTAPIVEYEADIY